MTVKCIEGGVPAIIMAKRLTKALRGKRRWLGFQSNHEHPTRQSIEQKLRELFDEGGQFNRIRLMDFIPCGSEKPIFIVQILDSTSSSLGFGILQVPHPISSDVRAVLESEDSLKQNGIQSLTMSGKIRLVRERLGLPRPSRKS